MSFRMTLLWFGSAAAGVLCLTAGLTAPSKSPPLVRYETGISRSRAARIARGYGFTFYYPTYWPRTLPAPSIYVSPKRDWRRPTGPLEVMGIGSHALIPPAQRDPTEKHNEKRLLRLVMTPVDRTPQRWRLRLRSHSSRARPARRDKYHGYRSLEVEPIRVRGVRALIHRERGYPYLQLAWAEGRTHVHVAALRVPEREVLRMVRSLRTVR